MYFILIYNDLKKLNEQKVKTVNVISETVFTF